MLVVFFIHEVFVSAPRFCCFVFKYISTHSISHSVEVLTWWYKSKFIEFNRTLYMCIDNEFSQAI